MQHDNPHITDVRGLGLMIGVEFDAPIKAFRQSLVKDHHMFTGAASTHILRLLPPLTLSRQQAEKALHIIRHHLPAFFGE